MRHALQAGEASAWVRRASGLTGRRDAFKDFGRSYFSRAMGATFASTEGAEYTLPPQSRSSRGDFLSHTLESPKTGYAMNKNIVLCSDGTWDGADNTAGASSNVLKLFNLLSGDLALGEPSDAEQERVLHDVGILTQTAKYIHGVGDSLNCLNKLLGGCLGTGLIARLLRGYTFVSRVYAPGDQIVLVGFSRGAYTARALSGFISAMGLLDWSALGLNPNGSDARGYEFAASAWYAYQKSRDAIRCHNGRLQKLEQLISEVPLISSWIARRPSYVPNVDICAVAVWDTVGALGIPKLIMDNDARIDVLQFADTRLSGRVARGFHAVAADEQRVDFTPTLWDPEPGRITQCIFPGAHADVGGGYPEGDESRLSDHTLAWMVNNLKGLNVRVSEQPSEPHPSATITLHMPWTSPCFAVRPTAVREFPEYQGQGIPIEIDDGLRARVRQTVVALTASVPPVRQEVPYLPISLAKAGYLDITSVEIRP
jgi:uncharacterized protein (DUF2235 family)